MQTSNQGFNAASAIRLAACALVALMVVPTPASADATARTDVPISQAPLGVGAVAVKPNFLFTLDDSASMNFEFMPGESYNWRHNLVGMYSRACNTIYFDPAVSQYPIPPTPTGATGTKILAAPTSATAVPVDGFYGYTGNTATMNVTTSFVLNDTDDQSWDNIKPREAFYFKWVGTGTPTPDDCWADLDATTGTTWHSGWQRVSWSDSEFDSTKKANFLAWFAFYRTRLNVMKSAAARAFNTADNSIRVGFITTSPMEMVSGKRKVVSSKYLPIKDFDATQKTAFINKIYAMIATARTPLLGALSRAGRHFAGLNTGPNFGMDEDPVQYSCQRNFTLLATDGYWDIDWDDETTYSWKLDSSLTEVGNQDSGTTARPFNDAFTADIRTQAIKGRWLDNWGDATSGMECGGQTITQPGHPQFGKNYVMAPPEYPVPGVDYSNPANLVKRPAFLELHLNDWTYSERRWRPKGYEDLFPVPSGTAANDIWEYWRWLWYPGGDSTATAATDPELLGLPSDASQWRLGWMSATPDQSWISASAPMLTEYTLMRERRKKEDWPYVVEKSGQTIVCAMKVYLCRTALLPGEETLPGCWGAADWPKSYPSSQTGSVTASTEDASTENTLADVAMYYYKTDLRTETLGNHLNKETPKRNVAKNNVPGDDANWETSVKPLARHQNMVTYTLGMGIAGYMAYDPNYQAQSNAAVSTQNYAQILSADKGWVAGWYADARNRVDDLWHAAVNGRGKFLSASDPQQLYDSLLAVIADLNAETAGGAGTAITSMTLTSETAVYNTEYEIGTWTGDLKKGAVNAELTGITWETATAKSKLNARVSVNCDNRTIYLMRGAQRIDFTWDTKECDSSLEAKGSAKSELANTAKLSSDDIAFIEANLKTTNFYTSTTSGRPNPAASDLVNFLRGQSAKEMSAADPVDRWFRQRPFKLGHLVDSKPVYVGRPFFNYSDHGYLDFLTSGGVTNAGYKTKKKTRTPMVYVGGNDGMLHAFNAETLEEEWAMIPSAMLPQLYRLASADFRLNSRFYVDGSITIGDVYDPNVTGSPADHWRTILIGSYNAGGQGHFAIDVTDPSDPKPLWEFGNATEHAESAVGLSFGNAIITKRREVSGAPTTASTNEWPANATSATGGDWVVLVGSGYNAPDGGARLFVLNALTGAVIDRLEVAGSTTSTEKGGLGRLAAWNELTTMIGNETRYVYAGDLTGRVWRFDITPGVAATDRVTQIAQLTDKNGSTPAVTATPELSFDEKNGRRMLFVATGRYLDASDATSTTVESVWGIADRFDGSTVARSDVAACAITIATNGDRTSGCTGAATKPAGWVVDFSLARERVTVTPSMQLGTLVFASSSPTTDDVCEAGGTSAVYYVDMVSGGAVASSAGGRVGNEVANAFITGVNIVRTTAGVRALIDTNEPKSFLDSVAVRAGAPTGRRVSWREMKR